MAKTGISEFTFGFAFLHEQANLHSANLSAAPILPSLIQEQEEGWDANLPVRGTPFFYQFKLSDYLTYGNAKYIKDGTYRAPYYRISLHRKNNSEQHNALKRLSATEPNTFYVAPEFTGRSEFNSAYLSREVARRSRLVPLTACRLISDSEQHYISYQSGSLGWNEHSEAFRHEVSYRGDEVESLYSSSKERWERIDFGYAVNLYGRVVENVKQTLEIDGIALSDNEQMFLHLSHSNKSLRTVLLHLA